MSNQLTHYGVKGMKWGVRRYQDKSGRLTSAGKRPRRLEALDTDTATTKRVKQDYNNLSDSEFKAKYYASKTTYAKRVAKYGDPYVHALKRREKQAQKFINRHASDPFHTTIMTKNRTKSENDAPQRRQKEIDFLTKVYNQDADRYPVDSKDHRKMKTSPNNNETVITPEGKVRRKILVTLSNGEQVWV